jgi:hypothetical protein
MCARVKARIQVFFLWRVLFFRYVPSKWVEKFSYISLGSRGVELCTWWWWEGELGGEKEGRKATIFLFILYLLPRAKRNEL